MRRFGLAGLAMVAALAGCGGDEPPAAVQSFPPPHYEFLPKLRLNVGSIEVVDHSLPVSPMDVASGSPAVPAQALARMAHDRLFAAGTTGSASFVIDQASIVREPNGALDGQLAVHLTVTAPGGVRDGYAEARVARQHVPGSDPEDPAANLYTLTRQMMDAMNVEFEYQVRHSLRAFLVEGGAVPSPVVAQPLGPDAGVPPPVPPPPALPPAVPDAPSPSAYPAPPQDGYQDPAAPPPLPPQQMSPQPGFLQLPAGPQ